jgi:hypothetical protein
VYALTLSRNYKPATDDSGIMPANDYTLKAFDESGLVAYRIISRGVAWQFYRTYEMMRLPCGDCIAVVSTLPYMLSL